MSTVHEPDTLRQHLPFELENAVLSCLDNPRDLAALAATCKYWASLIMPRHIEYRVLRLSRLSSTARQAVRSFDKSSGIWAEPSTPRPTPRLSRPLLDVLFHLCSSPAFTRNIREVNVTDRGPWKADIFPRTLVEPYNASDSSEASRNGSLWVFYMLQALREMQSLQSFTWDMPLYSSLGDAVDSSDPGKEQRAIFEILRQSKSLTALHVQIDRTMHFENFGSEDYPLWNITGLTSLSLTGPHGWLSCSSRTALNNLLHRNSFLQELTISYLPSYAIHFKSLYFPHLRKLCMRHAGLVEIAENEDHHILSFLYAHPTIEEMQWRSTFDSGMRPGLLPNLMRLETNAGLAYSLLRDETIPPRKWEAISPMVVYEQTMPMLRRIDGSHVKKLTIARYDSLRLIDEISRLFPNVTHLDITDYGMPSDHSIDQCISTLSNFRFLEYFKDSHLWNRIHCLPSDAERDTTIAHLATSCPNLTRIGCWYSEDGSDVSAVLIRDGDTGVTWRDEICFDS